jgi:hypothetical protein
MSPTVSLTQIVRQTRPRTLPGLTSTSSKRRSPTASKAATALPGAAGSRGTVKQRSKSVVRNVAHIQMWRPMRDRPFSRVDFRIERHISFRTPCMGLSLSSTKFYMAPNFLAVAANGPRGACLIGRCKMLAPQPCIRWDPWDPDHDAAMRIGGEAPG